MIFDLRFPVRSTDSTALHIGKDLAVSILCCHRHHPLGGLFLSDQASLLAPLGLRQTGVTRYHFQSIARRMCPDFPHRIQRSDVITRYISKRGYHRKSHLSIRYKVQLTFGLCRANLVSVSDMLQTNRETRPFGRILRLWGVARRAL